ncbi:MAG: hypothetical protein Q9179_008000, partial [Wetmoreana sp. 5 TL-2023]
LWLVPPERDLDDTVELNTNKPEQSDLQTIHGSFDASEATQIFETWDDKIVEEQVSWKPPRGSFKVHLKHKR